MPQIKVLKMVTVLYSWKWWSWTIIWINEREHGRNVLRYWRHLNTYLVNKTNSCTEFQFYWYYYSTCFGQSFCPSSGVLSRTSALVYFMQMWPFATRSSIWLLVANDHNCIKCTKADVRLRTPDDGQKDCPKHVEYNTNKTAVQCICWFYSQGICYEAQSYNCKKHLNTL